MSKSDRFKNLLGNKEDEQTGADAASQAKEGMLQRPEVGNEPGTKEIKKTTLYLEKDLHKFLKTQAAIEDRDMTGIVEELIKAYQLLRKGAPGDPVGILTVVQEYIDR